jgi:hypothetical protein
VVVQGAVPLLISVAKSYSGNLDIMVAAIGSLKNLAMNEDSVNQIVANGGLDLTVAALQNHLNHVVGGSLPVGRSGWSKALRSHLLPCRVWQGRHVHS